MRLALFFLPLLLVAFEAAGDDNELDIAEPCDEETCKLPACRCSSTVIPGGLAPRDTPQFVLLTFDDNVNVVNIPTYREMVYQRKNKNGCPAGVTFFVSHEYTNYQHINELYNQGFEIALHSISHQSPQEYWANASYEILMREIADQRILMAHFANIPFESIQGVRLPFLQMSGNASFQMMASAGLKYDISWPTLRYVNPGLWPYTLDYASTQDCVVPPCPNASIPGPWVVPMVTWTDLEGFPCAMVDTCYAIPNLQDEEGWYRFILRNFERHYLGSRAPFGFYVHEWFLRINPAVKRAVVRFLDLVNNLHDAFMVNGNDVIDWVQNPVPVNEYAKQACKTFIPTSCRPSSCGPLFSQDTMMTYWMQLCNVCPRNYPWVNNPLGQ